MIKLHTTMTSPFGHKCRLVVRLAELSDRVDVVDADNKAASFLKLNPLAKVPALELGNGQTLINSSLISAYLASVARDGMADKIYPQGIEEKWAALKREALADGITDAGVLIFVEAMRAETKQSQGWIHRQQSKIEAGLDAFEAEAPDFGDGTDIGLLALASGLKWFDMRSIGGDWRKGRPHLSAWFERFSQRDFWQETL